LTLHPHPILGLGALIGEKNKERKKERKGQIKQSMTCQNVKLDLSKVIPLIGFFF
jgi:hypothetical protein